MINLNDGAVGLPNVLYAQKHLPQRSWIPSANLVELVEHRWNKGARYLEGAMIPIRLGQVVENLDGIQFRQRLYTVEELRDIYGSVGMTLERTFHGNGRPKEPSDSQFEVFVTATRD